MAVVVNMVKTFVFYTIRGIFRLAMELIASQEGSCSIEIFAQE